MNKSLLEIILKHLDSRGLTVDALQRHLSENGSTCQLFLIDAYGEPGDIRIVADFLKLKPSDLLWATLYTEEYVRAVFDDVWPKYSGRVALSPDEAFQIFSQAREFRGETTVSLERTIESILYGLTAHSQGRSNCDYPDCGHTSVRCPVTGRQMAEYI